MFVRLKITQRGHIQMSAQALIVNIVNHESEYVRKKPDFMRVYGVDLISGGGKLVNKQGRTIFIFIPCCCTP